MALRGNLRDFSLPDVFQLVQLSGKTGILRIAGDDAEGSIWFREGEVFFAQSNWRRDQLGQRLVTAQKITPAALQRALEMQAGEPAGGRRLGQILVDEGYITTQVLETFVQEQIQDTIFDIMRWDEGEFDFEVLPEIVHEDIGLSVSVENIVMEGSRRLEEWNRIKKKVPSTGMVFKMATAPGEGTFEISLKPIEWNLLLLVDGTRAVRDLALETRRTDFEVARVIYGLFSAGLLEVASDEEVERLRAERAEREDRQARMRASRPPSAEGLRGEELLQEVVTKAPSEPVDEHAVADVPVESASPSPIEQPVAEPEVPEFLVSGASGPSADDMAVFEQMMSAVLTPPPVIAPPEPEASAVEPPAEVVVPATDIADAIPVDERPPIAEEEVAEPVAHEQVEYSEPVQPVAVPVEVLESVGEPAIADAQESFVAAEAAMTDESPDVGDLLAGATLESIPAEDVDLAMEYGQIDDPQPEPPAAAEDTAVAGMFIPTGDFETDLRTLGLGEYPVELLEQQPQDESVAVAPEDTGELAAPPAKTEEIAAGELPEERSDDDDNLDELLRSLEAETSVGDQADEGVISSGQDYGTEEPASSGVISTDAYLAEFDTGVGLSGGLADELTALTGGGTGRARPVTTVVQIPEPTEGTVVRRDQAVDRDLVMRIINGIEKL